MSHINSAHQLQAPEYKLINAVISGNEMEFIKLIVDKVKDIKDKNGNTALIYAAKLQRSSMVDSLIKNSISNPNARNNRGDNALAFAVSSDKLQTVVTILDNSSTTMVNSANSDGDTPLIIASDRGNIPIVTELLKRGANPNKANSLGNTPIFYASSRGHTEIVHRLLVKGANPGRKNKKGFTSLMYACWAGNENITKLLLKSNKSLPNHINENGNTALMNAIRPIVMTHKYSTQRIEIIKNLVTESKKTLHHQNPAGQSACSMVKEIGNQMLLNMVCGELEKKKRRKLQQKGASLQSH